MPRDRLPGRVHAVRCSRAGTESEVTADEHPPTRSGCLQAALPEDIDWEPFPSFPPSARLAVVVGDPSEPAPYVVRVKVPSGVRLMPHRHHEDRVYTVMSGVFYIGVGEQFDERKTGGVPAGCRHRPAWRYPSFPLG